MNIKPSLFLVFLLFCYLNGWAQNAFKVIPLGIKGGNDESNLSAYLVAPPSSNNYISLDAGTLNAGIQKAIDLGTLKGVAEDFLRKNIKGYLISHAHLDHVAGLIINSPADTNKYIYAMPKVLGIMRDKYFSWDTWANFGNEGEMPQLKKYTYKPLVEGTEEQLTATEMTVQAYPLSHVNPTQSTAFLIGANNNYLLYLGDTGADEIEKTDQLMKLWRRVAPLISSGQLKAIFLEVSFPNSQPENQLFGYLTPKLFYKELGKLQQLTNPDAFGKLSIIVTHIKPPHYAEVKQELQKENKLQLNLIFPEQGKLFMIN